jgi:hypothetical protein
VNIGTLKNFRYQTYMMHLFFYLIHEHFPKLRIYKKPTPNVEIYFVNKDKNEGMFRFINEVILRVFILPFGSLLRRVSEELKNHL